MGTNYRPDAAITFYTPGTATKVLSHNPDTCDEQIWITINGGYYQGMEDR